MIAGVHLRSAPNIGDRASSPLLYFDVPGRTRTQDVRDPVADSTAVIAGGGAWPKRLRKLARRASEKSRIAWGVGRTSRRLGPLPPDAHRKDARRWHLYAHRDWGCEGRYVPCASCMSTEFDAPVPEPTRELVFYGHAKLRPLQGENPRLTNDAASLAEVVQFLASGETVVTSSYHGVYWATLLGRRVVAVPYGAKFWHLARPPASAAGGDWRAALPKARAYSGALEEARDLNREFHADVLELLAERRAA